MIRVFPRRTKWTPNDDLAFVGYPPLFRLPEQPVRISVAFTWDVPEALRLLLEWRKYYSDVEIGGPALSTVGEEFIPGRFLKQGVVITSRGCPNRCWFCSVWEREPRLIELPITEGWNIVDDNILACSKNHFLKVCEMVKKQNERPVFSGGLDAKLLTKWHVDLLVDLKPDRLYFAYDTEDDYEPLVEAGKYMREAGIPIGKHVLMAYVLIGYKGDTIHRAETRLRETIEAGFTPMAMLYRGKNGILPEKEWRRFQRHWARPRIIYQNMSGEDVKCLRLPGIPN